MMRYKDCRWSVQTKTEEYVCTCPYSGCKSKKLEDDSLCSLCMEYYVDVCDSEGVENGIDNEF